MGAKTEVWKKNIHVENSEKSEVFKLFALTICPMNSTKVKQKQRSYDWNEKGQGTGQAVMTEQQRTIKPKVLGKNAGKSCSHKEFVSKINKELLWLNKKINNPTTNWEKDMNRQFLKDDRQMAISTDEKTVNISH